MVQLVEGQTSVRAGASSVELKQFSDFSLFWCGSVHLVSMS